jgi:hypothetical protein
MDPLTHLLLTRRFVGTQPAVPEKIIQRLLRRLDVPDPTEAHAVVWVGDREQ